MLRNVAKCPFSLAEARPLRVLVWCWGLCRIRCHAAISAPCARVECMRQGAQALRQAGSGQLDGESCCPHGRPGLLLFCVRSGPRGLIWSPLLRPTHDSRATAQSNVEFGTPVRQRALPGYCASTPLRPVSAHLVSSHRHQFRTALEPQRRTRGAWE